MSGRLTIRRIRAEYLAARDADDPARARDACESALRQHLSQSLASALSRWCDRSDESIWLVRSLALEVTVGAQWKDDELAGAFTERISKELGTTLTGDGDGASAIRFAGAAEYLARFLADAAAGDAWSRWYYARFRGLRALPTSAALRTALTEDPRLGLNAMRRMGDAELARVVSSLSSHDRTVVLERFAETVPANEDASAFSHAWSAWEQHASRYAEAEGRVLALFVRAADGRHGGAALRTAIGDVEAIQQLRANLHPSEMHEMLASMSAGASLEALAARFRPSERLARAASAFASLRGVAPELLARMLHHEPRRSTDDEAICSTPFGGLFFFLPQLDAIPVERWLGSWPGPEGASAAGGLRLLVAAKCMGGSRAAAAFGDTVLRRLLRVGPEFTLPAAHAWLSHAGPERRRALARAVEHAANAEGIDLRMGPEEMLQLALPGECGIARAWDKVITLVAQLVLRMFARRLPGFSESRFPHLYRNFLDARATLEAEAERLVARVARPPLYLELSLTGMTRTTYLIRGESRPIAVFAQE